MKNIILLMIVAFQSTFLLSASAQDCSVANANLQGKYEGACKNGKADGEGNAVGIDSYQGSFKAGLEHGHGTSVWKNGNVYEGDFTKGMKDGKGQMVYKRAGKPDSIVTGFWKRDNYLGKNEYAYKIYNRTNQFSKVEVKANGSGPANSITIDVSSTTAGSVNSTLTGLNPKLQISEILLSQGSYTQSQINNKGQRTSSRTLLNVQYPFRAKIRIGSQEADIEIATPGAWLINLGLNQ